MNGVNKWTAFLVSSAVIVASAAGYLFFSYQKKRKHQISGKRNKKRGSVNIGGKQVHTLLRSLPLNFFLI